MRTNIDSMNGNNYLPTRG